ncbi:hypothetical protein GCM10017687_22300 [Streptomyces echinatus]
MRARPDACSPSRATVPDLGVRAVLSSDSNVLFPAPLGPRRPVTPAGKARETSSRATVAPYRTVTPETAATG